MKPSEIILQLEPFFDKKLAEDLVNEFLELKKDVQTQTLSRASVGKFIETVVQALEFLETGTYSAQPSVDSYLKNVESRQTIISDDLKICLSRIARATYTLRNKRNILHKGKIDTNIYDLKYAYSAAQWILTEFVKEFITVDINKAGQIIEFIQIPVNQFIERIDDRTLIHAKCTIAEEAMLILYSEYPNYLTTSQIHASLDRRLKNSVTKAMAKLWDEKMIHKDKNGYKLTQAGFLMAEGIIKSLADEFVPD